jgi:16S rRNA A1518/A1519 N6-dimethyltransferase RsmA/KsgA/DIM1 with predicted DNA glycosylase/AP lyase activity
VFERIVRGIFLQRRKTLANALRPVAESLGHPPEQLLERAGVDGRLRPEALTLADIGRLSRAVL